MDPVDLQLVAGVAAVPLIVGLVQLLKGLGLNARWAGLAAIGLGLVASFGYFFFQDRAEFKAVVVGLAVGLAAAGLWSTTKNALGQ